MAHVASRPLVGIFRDAVVEPRQTASVLRQIGRMEQQTCIQGFDVVRDQGSDDRNGE